MYSCNLSVGVALVVRFTTNGMCEKNNNIHICGANKRVIVAHELLLLAAAVRSFAHMPLELSDRNYTSLVDAKYDINQLRSLEVHDSLIVVYIACGLKYGVQMS